MTSGPDLSTEVGRRAWEKLIAQEQREIDAEIEAQQHQRELSRAERDRARRAGALRAIEEMKKLTPMYAERNAAAGAALDALSHFVAIERGLLADERRVLATVDATGLDDAAVEQLRMEMRQSAGLPAQRDRLDLSAGVDESKRVALTCLIAIVNGDVGPGTISQATFILP